MRYFGTFWDIFGHLGASWDFWGRFGTFSDVLGSHGSALWFNRGTGSKPEIQCFLGLYLRFYEIVVFKIPE